MISLGKKKTIVQLHDLKKSPLCISVWFLLGFFFNREFYVIVLLCKWTQTGRLERTEIYSLAVLKARISRCQECWFFLEGLRGNLLCAAVLASGGSWQPLAFGAWDVTPTLLLSSQRVPFVSLSLSLLRRPCHWIRVHPHPGWSHLKVLNFVTSAKTPFQNKLKLRDSRWIYLGNHCSTHYNNHGEEAYTVPYSSAMHPARAF